MSIDLAGSGIAADDAAFCERAVTEAGVAAIPVSAFYAEDPVRNVIRLCFAKKGETLDAGSSGSTAGLVRIEQARQGAPHPSSAPLPRVGDREEITAHRRAIAPAIQAETISCRVWKIMIGRMISPAAAAGKSRRAIGAPATRLLTEPQNRMAARLGRAGSRRAGRRGPPPEHQAEQGQQQGGQHGELGRRQPPPDAFHRGRREGAVDGEQDRALVDRPGHRRPRLDEAEQQRPQGMADHEGQEQQGEDAAEGGERDLRALRLQHEQGEQRGSGTRR